MHEALRILWVATWGNNMATAEWGAVLSLAGWLGRERIGRRAGRWLARHLAEHLEQQDGGRPRM